MSNQVVDARGLSCPQPVILSRDAVKKMGSGGTVEVLVDAATSRDNVRRAAENQGCTVDVQDEGDGFRVTIKK